MSSRKTMRPVTLRRVIEVSNLVKKSNVDIHDISDILKVSRSHAVEIVREIERMKLINLHNNECRHNQNTISFLDNFEYERWRRLHKYFISHYPFYKEYVNLLSGKINNDLGLSINQIQIEAEKQSLNLNQTSIEVLSDWCDRLGIVQRHLYSGRIYLLKDESTNSAKFGETFLQCYFALASSKRLAQVFVEIPRLREDVCERLKINRDTFDTVLEKFYLENVGRIELSGAPITTLAKKSPLSEKKIMLEGKQAILSPKFELRRERKGLLVSQKAYYYVAIHENL